MADAGAQQQRRRSTARSSRCGQCHVNSRVTRLNSLRLPDYAIANGVSGNSERNPALHTADTTRRNATALSHRVGRHVRELGNIHGDS